MDDSGISNSDNEELNEPISLDDNAGGTGISHSPLNLGGPPSGEVPAARKAAKPVKPTEKKRVEKKPAEKAAPLERITGVKTFFTKLHAGAIEFLDEQITTWLNNNPDITIKRTNTVVGDVQGKKSEPNIIVTVWY